jgi:hypothetical protein
MQEGVKAVGDSLFIHTTYSFNSAVNSTYKYALDLIAANGGTVSSDKIVVKTQVAVEPALEVSFPNLVFDKKVSIFDEQDWTLKGDWIPFEVTSWDKKISKQSLYAEKAGDELEITFTGTGISLIGNWYKDGRFYKTFFLAAAILIALREPLGQLPQGGILLIIYGFITGFLMNFLQAVWYGRAGFLASLSIRLGHYFIWHILLGLYIELFELI